jgi:hypothetical protein
MREGRLVVMNEYQDLTCKRCGKVDEKAALARGIQGEVLVRSKRPFLPSADDFYLLDERGKHLFAGLLPDQFDFIRIPSSPTFCVAAAREWFEPLESDPGFQFVSGRCKECGRPREVIWGKDPPTVPQVRPFMAINLESIQGARIA